MAHTHDDPNIYYVPHHSPWPFVGSITLFTTMVGVANWMNGHAWGQPVWSWNGVESAAATFICTNDSSHVEVENAVITNEITTPAPGIVVEVLAANGTQVEYDQPLFRVATAAGETH